MKKFIILCGILALSACSTTKEEIKPQTFPKVSGFKDVEYMQRVEVIQASKDCINARMKPVIQNVPQKTEFGTIVLPVLVNCEIYNSIR